MNGADWRICWQIWLKKYALDLDIENLPNITGDNHVEDDRNKEDELLKNWRKRLVNNDIRDMIRVSKLLLEKMLNNEVAMDYRGEEIEKSNTMIYIIEDGLSKMETTFDGDMVWLSKAQMAELF